jgi:L-threonylcarbamoyladenylate synthase
VIAPETHNQIATAVKLLEAGGTVAFPTETVYGLGADATNPAAIRQIYDIKQRPTNHPLIVHIGDISHLSYWAQDIPDSAWKLARHFWPGPLTLILRRSLHVPDIVTGGQDTVGLRIPAHPIALALLDALGPHKALAAPSANRFGRISPTTAAHVQQELGDKVSMILDGGACEVGLESTIVSFDDETAMVLRPGGIPLSALESVLGKPAILADPKKIKIRTSGILPTHYAPTTPLTIYPTEQLWGSAQELAKQGLRTIVISWSEQHNAHAANPLIQQVVMPSDPINYGKKLYAILRQYDHEAFDQLLIEAPPDHPSWLAIMDRLQRASYKQNNA